MCLCQAFNSQHYLIGRDPHEENIWRQNIIYNLDSCPSEAVMFDFILDVLFTAQKRANFSTICYFHMD